MTKLSILIPTVPEDEVYFIPLMRELRRQIFPKFEHQIEIIVETDNGENTTGAKRNELLKKADGDYVAFVDSDDMVAPNYIRHLMEGIVKGVDCCSLLGIITEDGKNPLIFEHSIRYYQYKTNAIPAQDSRYSNYAVTYERYPNHISCIKASIAKQFKFPDKYISEDSDWAAQVHKSGMLRVEHYIPEVIYHYLHRSK